MNNRLPQSIETSNLYVFVNRSIIDEIKASSDKPNLVAQGSLKIGIVYGNIKLRPDEIYVCS